MLIGYHYTASAILVIPLRNRHAGTITEVWRILNEQFATAGVNPNTYVMDNEASWNLKESTKEKYID